MNNLNQLGWCDFFENHVSPDDKYIIARIIAGHKNAFDVSDGKSEFRAAISGRFFHELKQTADMPVVGDWILMRRSDAEADTAMIEKVIPRRTMLRRRAPTDRKTFGSDGEQVIVSNVDIIFIVTSLNQNFNLSRIERTLALVYSSGATPVILLSKSDLCDDISAKISEVEQVAFGVPVIQFSNITGQNIDVIAGMIKPGMTACLIGSSGVGKTTLTNTLCSLSEKTAEIRAKDGRGRHATTGRSLHILQNGGMIIDTPGLREIGLLDGAACAEQMFSDIEELIRQCRFSNCTHTNEPDCAVNTAIESGDLEARQFKNYIKMQKEARWASDSAGARRAKQEQSKEIAKFTRKIKW